MDADLEFLSSFAYLKAFVNVFALDHQYTSNQKSNIILAICLFYLFDMTSKLTLHFLQDLYEV